VADLAPTLQATISCPVGTGEIKAFSFAQFGTVGQIRLHTAIPKASFEHLIGCTRPFRRLLSNVSYAASSVE
jgi:hypothetical protein